MQSYSYDKKFESEIRKLKSVLNTSTKCSCQATRLNRINFLKLEICCRKGNAEPTEWRFMVFFGQILFQANLIFDLWVWWIKIRGIKSDAQ